MVNIKTLISAIYECQKKIIFLRRTIRVLTDDGYSTSKEEKEIKELEKKITEFQKELRKKYQLDY
ncbi:MAG: hypothetical protein WC333_02340 [Dehalococcoidia bacterium]